MHISLSLYLSLYIYIYTQYNSSLSLYMLRLVFPPTGLCHPRPTTALRVVRWAQGYIRI